MAISSEMTTKKKITHRSSHRGIAFLIEALIVLGFLMFAVAVFVRLFSSAQIEARDATNLSQAVIVATNYAEEFSANPTKVAESDEWNGFVITCKVSPEAGKAGTLYNANITVSKDGKEVYVLNTARYVSGGGDAA